MSDETALWEDEWTDAMCELAERVANGALHEVGIQNTIWYEVNGLAYSHLPLSPEEDRALERAMSLGFDAVRRMMSGPR